MSINKNTSAQEVVEIFNTNLTGKVIIITGPNYGIGLETARVLASVGAQVIIPCRTLEKSQEAIKKTREIVPDAKLVPMQLDLSDLSSVRSFVASFLSLDLSLDILINNAGTIAGTIMFTKEGFEITFGVNHLGHFLLVDLLTERLETSAPSRIVIVSSSEQMQLLSSHNIAFDNLNVEKS